MARQHNQDCTCGDESSACKNKDWREEPGSCEAANWKMSNFPARVGITTSVCRCSSKLLKPKQVRKA